MATKGERRALYFLAAVALLGAGTRAWRAKHTIVSNAGLEDQIQAVDSAGMAGRRVAGSPRPKPVKPPAGQPVDLDVASPNEIEKLPGIGPALARRIVKDRDANGPFGCLAALDRVKGVGPSLLARVDSLATFSAAGGAPCGSAGRPPEE
jgi:DNA uptake protein ComE-like DNA-binding protein